MDFHSRGKTPDTIDLLKIEQRELATRSAHSRRSCAEILSRPVALDLQSLDNKEKTVKQSVVLSSNLCSVSIIIIQIRRSISIFLDGVDKFQSNTRKMIIKTNESSSGSLILLLSNLISFTEEPWIRPA